MNPVMSLFIKMLVFIGSRLNALKAVSYFFKT